VIFRPAFTALLMTQTMLMLMNGCLQILQQLRQRHAKNQDCRWLRKKELQFRFSRGNPVNNSTRFLGTVLDSSLRMKAEVERVRGKAGAKLIQPTRLKTMLPKSAADELFKAEVLPVPDYSGAAIEIIGSEAQKDRLNSVVDNYSRCFGPPLNDSLQLRRKVGLFTMIYSTQRRPPPELKRRWPILRSSNNAEKTSRNAFGCG
jgi:hypothetical protein